MITRGTTLECFLDLMERISPELYVKRRLLANILDVEDATVRRWVIGSGNPVGMSMVSLRYYLDFLGYQVSELERLTGHVVGIGKLLAFRVLTLEEMLKLIGGKIASNQLLAITRGEQGTSLERGEIFRGIVESYRQELLDKQRATARLVIVNPTPTSVSTVVSTQKAVSTVVGLQSTTLDLKLKVGLGQDEQFKVLATSLLDVARLYADPGVSEEVRDRLRTVVGQQNIFDLKNLLSRLCSSKAFSNQQ